MHILFRGLILLGVKLVNELAVSLRHYKLSVTVTLRCVVVI